MQFALELLKTQCARSPEMPMRMPGPGGSPRDRLPSIRCIPVALHMSQLVVHLLATWWAPTTSSRPVLSWECTVMSLAAPPAFRRRRPEKPL